MGICVERGRLRQVVWTFPCTLHPTDYRVHGQLQLPGDWVGRGLPGLHGLHGPHVLQSDAQKLPHRYVLPRRSRRIWNVITQPCSNTPSVFSLNSTGTAKKSTMVEVTVARQNGAVGAEQTGAEGSWGPLGCSGWSFWAGRENYIFVLRMSKHSLLFNDPVAALIFLWGIMF